MTDELYQQLLHEHTEQTVAAARTRSEVLILHDTTEFELGQWYDYDTQKTSSALDFAAHLSLAVDATLHPVPLGVLALHELVPDTKPVARTKKKVAKKKPPKPTAEPKSEESPAPRWVSSAHACEERLGPSVCALHVMDREADSYAVYAGLMATESRFVVRAADRRRAGVRDTKLIELSGAPLQVQREVPLSRRKGSSSAAKAERGGLDVRAADLLLTRCAATLRRPNNLSDPTPRELTVNALRVSEPSSPPGQPGVAWLLLTNEPLDTPLQMTGVLDAYRCRPTIETFLRALKLGCLPEYESIEELEPLLPALVSCFPVACELFRLYQQSRAEPDAPAEQVVGAEQVEVLRLVGRRELPARPTLREFVWTVAGLGGHLARNQDPGWNTLGAGWYQLRAMELGVRAYRKAHALGEA